MTDININRLRVLNQKVNNGSATKEEKNEFMKLLYLNGSITKEQYDSFLSGENSDGILKTALTIAAIVLFGWVISALSKD